MAAGQSLFGRAGAILSLTMLTMVTTLSHAAPPLQKSPAQSGTSTTAGAPASAAQIPDNPVIQNISTLDGYEGRYALVSWKVVPGIGGSPITNVKISDGYKSYYDGSGAMFTGLGVSLPLGNHILTLTARNQKGNTSTRNFNVTILPDEPDIRSFALTSPSGPVIQGDTATFTWNVKPGARGEGSPISAISITEEQPVVWRGDGNASSAALTLNTPGSRTFKLLATNRAGKTSSKSISVNVVRPSDLMSKVTITNLDAAPAVFASGQPVDFQVSVRNDNTGIPLRPVNIYVTYAGRVVGTLTDLTLPPGPTPYRFTLRDSGSTATAGSAYVVDVEFRGLHKTRNFKTLPVTMYTIEPSTP